MKPRMPRIMFADLAESTVIALVNMGKKQKRAYQLDYSVKRRADLKFAGIREPISFADQPSVVDLIRNMYAQLRV